MARKRSAGGIVLSAEDADALRALARYADDGAAKGLLPMQAAVLVSGGEGQTYDGQVAACVAAPGLRGLEFAVNAATLAAAVSASGDGAALSLGDSVLTVSGGGFTARLHLLDPAAFPRSGPGEGDALDAGGLADAFSLAEPFMGSRAWSTSALVRAGEVFASDGDSLLVAVACGVGIDFSCTRRMAQLVASASRAERVVSDANSMTLFFPGGWLRAQSTIAEWPDVSKLLGDPAALPEAPDGLWEAVARVAPFGEGPVEFSGRRVSRGEAWVELGAELPPCRFSAKALQSVAPIAPRIDLSTFPRCRFGDPERAVRGAIAGVAL